MRKFCIRFKNSIIALMALVLYLGCMAILFGLLGIDNWQVLELSRTSVVMAFTYVLFGFFMARTYGGFDVGVRKSRPIVISLSLATVLDDIITYMVLLIMNTNDENGRLFRPISLGFLVLSMLLQVILVSVLTHLGNRFFFYVTEPEKTLVIAGKEEELASVEKAVGIFHRRYAILDRALPGDPALTEKISRSDAVFLYDVPRDSRAGIVDLCYRRRISVYCFPDIEDILIHNSEQIMFSDLPFYCSGFEGKTFEQRVIKRLMDIVISGLLLILTSPILLVSAIAIKKQDGGPVFFTQERATIRGRSFRIYKFRTMQENIENRSVTKDDDRITPGGRILRKYRIDELPQLINIIRGEMSLVGPRPEMLENVREYTKELPEFEYRLRVKAGLTGYAQVVGKYNTSSRDKLMLDLMYIESFSIMTDIRILLQTLTVLFTAEESTEGF